MAVSPEPDAYAVLHVEPSTSRELISALYRALARRFHPDGPTPDAARMREINRAYNEIKTPELRRRYDAARRRVPVGPGRSAAPAAAAADPAPAAAADPAPFDPSHMATSKGGTARAGESLRARLARRSASFGGLLDIGPYAGWRVVEVARRDPEYLRWLSRHPSGVRFRREIAFCLPDDEEVGWRAKIVG